MFVLESEQHVVMRHGITDSKEQMKFSNFILAKVNL